MAVKDLETQISVKPSASQVTVGPSITASRPFAGKPKKVKKSDFDTLVDAAGFVLVMGILITGASLVLIKGLRNHFSFYLFDTGVILCLYAFSIKSIDLCLKLMGVRR